jgi:hypothetical protein
MCTNASTYLSSERFSVPVPFDWSYMHSNFTVNGAHYDAYSGSFDCADLRAICSTHIYQYCDEYLHLYW